MKQPKRPTRRIKMLFAAIRKDQNDWEILGYDTRYVTARHRFSGRIESIPFSLL